MAMCENDKRVIKTKAIIRDAYVQLLKEHKPAKITVKSLCDKAYVSRKTFYSHYDTIDDVLLEILDSCFAHQRIGQAIKIHEWQLKYYRSDYDYYRKLVHDSFAEQNRIIRSNSEVLKILIDADDANIEQKIRHRCIDVQLPFPEEETAALQVAWEIIGAEKYAFLRYVVLHPEISVEEIADFQCKTVDTYVHFLYTNSETFIKSFNLERGDIPFV